MIEVLLYLIAGGGHKRPAYLSGEAGDYNMGGGGAFIKSLLKPPPSRRHSHQKITVTFKCCDFQADLVSRVCGGG